MELAKTGATVMVSAAVMMKVVTGVKEIGREEGGCDGGVHGSQMLMTELVCWCR